MASQVVLIDSEKSLCLCTTVHASYRRTSGQTDGWTDGQKSDLNNETFSK